MQQHICEDNSVLLQIDTHSGGTTYHYQCIVCGLEYTTESPEYVDIEEYLN